MHRFRAAVRRAHEDCPLEQVNNISCLIFVQEEGIADLAGAWPRNVKSTKTNAINNNIEYLTTFTAYFLKQPVYA